MSSDPVPTPDRIQNLLKDLRARDLLDEKISPFDALRREIDQLFDKICRPGWRLPLRSRLGTRVVAADDRFVIMREADLLGCLTDESLASSYEGFVAQTTKIGELYTALAKEALKPIESAIANVQAAAARGSVAGSSEDKSVDMPAMLDMAAQSLARSAELLTKAADERGSVVAELAARERRIDRVQEETRALLDALVAGHD